VRPTTGLSGSDFSLEQRRLPDGRVVVAVHGAVDLFAAPELKRRLIEAVDRGTSEIILDLSATEFLDSTGLGALLATYKRLSVRGGRLVVVLGETSVVRVFEITGLDSILTFADSLDAAIAGAGVHA
jgi:anti-anti-sigma factor